MIAASLPTALSLSAQSLLLEHTAAKVCSRPVLLEPFTKLLAEIHLQRGLPLIVSFLGAGTNISCLTFFLCFIL